LSYLLAVLAILDMAARKDLKPFMGFHHLKQWLHCTDRNGKLDI
jgi:hypothetical protein